MFQDLFGPPPVSAAPRPPQLPPSMEDWLMQRQPTAPQIAPEQSQMPAPQDEGIQVSGGTPYEHKGRFGVKGTLRDILGTLGDAFLVQSGNKPMYAPRRQEEMKADALQNFMDEVGGPASRLNEAGFASDAYGVYKDFVANQLAKDKYALERDKYSADRQDAGVLNANRQVSTQDKALGIVRSLLANVKDEASYMRVKPIIDAYGQKAGISDMLGSLPQSYDPSVNTWGIDPQQLQRLQDYDADRALRERLAREAEAARNERFRESEAGRESRFKRSEEGKDRRSTSKSKPSFKLPPPPPGFK